MVLAWRRDTARHYLARYWSQTGFSSGLRIKVGYLLLQQLDLILTVAAVSAGFHEINPIIKHMLASPFQLVMVKLVIPLLIVWFVAGRLLLPAIGLLALVVAWNVKELICVLC